ncbi:MAG TPA: histone deacetylase [Vicinamibacterales bacterium]|jgi:acetoin utilization deacetylase AcuC-like enzyme
MLILTTSRFQDHVTPPGHPERPERAHVFDAVAARWRERGGSTAAPRAARDAELARVHDPEYLETLARMAGRPAMLDADTFLSPESIEVARFAAGATVEAAEHAVDAREPAFALVRPPGHHAERDRAMGFCLFNNVAVAAASLLDRGVSRIAIVDIDVHHGNGTQAMFYDDPRVLYVSTHQYPFYPGTGAANEVGEKDGRGFTVNIPMDAGSIDADFELVHREIVEPVLEEFRPELLLVSAGYDAHEHDPLASMRMTTDGYASVMRRLRQIAARHGALACVTEGGYEMSALGGCLEASFSAIADGDRFEPISKTDAQHRSPVASPRGERAVAAARAALKPFWRGL